MKTKSAHCFASDRKAVKGFSLPELMVALAIGAILISLAVPGMRHMLQNGRITAQANNLLTSISLARSEAVKRGVPVTICRSSNLTSCIGGVGSWAAGWIIFDDPDSDGVVDNTETVIRVQQALKGNPALTGPAPVIFQPSGLVNAAAVFTHTIPGCIGDQGRTINIGPTGRAAVLRQAC